MTARQLADRLSLAGVRFDLDAGAIIVTGTVPADLEPVAKVLKTGLAALSSGRVWYALLESGRPTVLNPAALIPDWAKFLAAGDTRAGWDRVRLAWRLDCPQLFALTKEPSRSNRRLSQWG